ncbi:MAG: LuxR family transcriptional regulator [Eggerthellaceae bacterium]|nr:LuxR family transcriptional regulator [Eggerthellaceae bacterium]
MVPALLMVALLTFHWGWEHLVLYAPFVKSPYRTDASSWFLANLSAVLFTCAMLAFASKLEPYLKRKSAFYLAAACLLVGTAGVIVSSFSLEDLGISDGTMAFVFGASNLVASFGVSLGIFLICAAFARVPEWSHEHVVNVATLTGLVVYVFVDSLPFLATCAIVLLLPVGMCVMYRMVFDESAPRRSKSRPSVGKLGAPIWQLLVLLVTSMSINYLRGTHAVDLTAGDQKAAFFALITLTVAVSFAIVHAVRKISGFSVKPVVVLALALACIFLDVSSLKSELAQEVAVFSAFFLYVSYLYQVLSACAASRSEGMFRALAVICLFNQIGLVLGRFMADASLVMMLSGTTDYLVIALFVMIAHLSGTIVYLFKAKRNDLAQEPVVEDESQENLSDGTTMRQIIARNSRLVGEIHNLTSREVDVLSLVAEGKSLNGVSEGLGVSVNTAKSHMSRLYRKLGVHTKEEVFAIVMQADQVRLRDGE